MPVLVGDRFYGDRARRWRDLATGQCVRLAVRVVDDGDLRQHPLPRSGALTRAGDDVLIDCGPVGVTHWFDARGRVSKRRAAEGCRDGLQQLASDLAALAEKPGAVGIRVERAHVGCRSRRQALAHLLARRLRPAGFVVVRARFWGVADLAGTLAHRHLVILVLDDHDRRSVDRWVTTVASVSPRSHLVVHLEGGPVASDEHGQTTGDARSSVTRSAAPRRRLVRAGALARRGRGAEAMRWLCAAVESARRHGNPVDQAEAGAALIRHVIDRDDWSAAHVVACRLQASLVSASARARLAPVLAGVRIAWCEFDVAEALLAMSVAGDDGQDARVALAVRREQAAMRFWQGRFEEARACVVGLEEDPASVLLCGLIAWACGDRACLAAPGKTRAPADQDGRFASAAWSVLATTLDPSRSGLDVHLATLRQCAAGRLSGSLRRLGALILAEGELAAGRAPALSLREELWRRAPPLHALAARWMMAASSDPSIVARTTALVTRSGARGITRWGKGESSMHLVHALPVVLQLVHDAEDEQAALRGSCAWMREHAGAEAVSVLGGDSGPVIAACGRVASTRPAAAAASIDPTPPPAGTTEISAAVRYGGVRIGTVVARGPSERSATLREAASTLAALCAPALRARLDALDLARARQQLAPEILGRSPAMTSLREAIGRAAAAPFPVLLEGESGSGKELVARAVHRLSARRDRRLAVVNCAALTDELIETELFGHARGAFTGALASRTGLFEDANGGTLFLDEVSELSPRAQAKLLRVLQEREVRRVGENVPRPVDVRIIAATNRPLADAVAQGAFRADLLFRLAVVRIRLPPLRDRPEDVALLALAFWRRLIAEAGKHAVLAPQALAGLCRHRWPGNVRELQNVVASLVVQAPGRGRVTARHVAQVLDTAAGGEGQVQSLTRARADCERQTVVAALVRHGGRKAPAARELGMSRQGLTKAMRRLGLAGGEAEGVA